MRDMYHEHQTFCPYCGETFTAFLDLSQGDHHTIEDCAVCCRPIEFLIKTDNDDLISVETFTDSESAF